MPARRNSAENVRNIAVAMRAFREGGDASVFEGAIVEYVHHERLRNSPVEHVLAELEAIADREEGARTDGAVVLERTELRRVLLRGVLLAFYGRDALERRESVDRERRARNPDDLAAP